MRTPPLMTMPGTPAVDGLPPARRQRSPKKPKLSGDTPQTPRLQGHLQHPLAYCSAMLRLLPAVAAVRFGARLGATARRVPGVSRRVLGRDVWRTPRGLATINAILPQKSAFFENQIAYGH